MPEQLVMFEAPPAPTWPTWFAPHRRPCGAHRVAMGLHPVGAELGPAGERCGTCAHLIGEEWDRCRLYLEPDGRGVRQRWRACASHVRR